MQAEAWNTEARLAQLRMRRQQQARRRRMQRVAVGSVITLAAGAVGLAALYGGSSSRLAEGVTIAGVDVGGMAPTQAAAVLERHEATLRSTPLLIRYDAKDVQVLPGALGVEIGWGEAVASARDELDGFLPLRGLRRLTTRAFGTEITAHATADPAKLERLLSRLASADVPPRNAAVRFAGLRPILVEERAGQVLDRVAAKAAILGAFADLDRAPVRLTRRVAEPRVTAEMLQPALEQARTAVSRPVTLRLDGAAFTVSKRQLARLIDLPEGGERPLRIGGPGADAYFKALQVDVNRSPRSADFVPVEGGRVLIKPSLPGRALDVPRTAEALLAAALRPAQRTARMVVATTAPARTTAEAKAMGITGIVSSYTTIYGGDANRVHNVALVADLIDDTLIPPGKEFSFNATTGERNAAKGFREAPVIINGELQTGLGGGVCQVSTTVFNAAYEAGLEITSRTNHALYISHYPQGRDATVNYPDIDLKFVNDTGRWLLLRTFVGSSALTVNLYGTPQGRRVETEVAPLEAVGKAPTTWRKDATLTRGTRIVASAGSPARSTSVHRLVYLPNGKLLHDDTWSSYYRGEKKIVLVGTKPKPEPVPKKTKQEQPPATQDGPAQPPAATPTSPDRPGA